MRRSSISEQARQRNLAFNMQAYRRARQLTVQQAARFARLPVGTWRRLEAGEISASQQTLERVAEALDTRPEILVGKPLRRTMWGAIFCIAGLKTDEMPEELVRPFLELQRHRAKTAGHTLETLVETALALNESPLDLLDKLLRERPSPSKTVH